MTELYNGPAPRPNTKAGNWKQMNEWKWNEVNEMNESVRDILNVLNILNVHDTK